MWPFSCGGFSDLLQGSPDEQGPGQSRQTEHQPNYFAAERHVGQKRELRNGWQRQLADALTSSGNHVGCTVQSCGEAGADYLPCSDQAARHGGMAISNTIQMVRLPTLMSGPALY